MRIPEIADRLRELAVDLAAPELTTLADELRRRAPVKKSPNCAEPMTPALRAAIRDHHRLNPGDTHASIGTRFNVNPGRVSETLAGYRH